MPLICFKRGSFSLSKKKDSLTSMPPSVPQGDIQKTSWGGPSMPAISVYDGGICRLSIRTTPTATISCSISTLIMQANFRPGYASRNRFAPTRALIKMAHVRPISERMRNEYGVTHTLVSPEPHSYRISGSRRTSRLPRSEASWRAAWNAFSSCVPFL